MTHEELVAAALRREGYDPEASWTLTLVHAVRAGLRFVVDHQDGACQEIPPPCHPLPAYPEACHIRMLGYLVAGARRWRTFRVKGSPPPEHIPALMDLWCERLPTWSAAAAHSAFLKVRPFGGEDFLVALVVYQWLNHTWADPVLPPPSDLPPRAPARTKS